MQAKELDVAQVRLDNAHLLFEEFVRATARHADAATLRGLERRFAERLQIQPSYWSQIKSRSRQIGERLARQFEQLMHKPRGWMDEPHGAGSLPAAGGVSAGGAAGGSQQLRSESVGDERLPQDDDERFIVGLVLTYYRRHPARARARLLDLLGEVLVPEPGEAQVGRPGVPGTGSSRNPASGKPAPLGADDERGLWLRSQAGVAPLKSRK